MTDRTGFDKMNSVENFVILRTAVGPPPLDLAGALEHPAADQIDHRLGLEGLEDFGGDRLAELDVDRMASDEDVGIRPRLAGALDPDGHHRGVRTTDQERDARTERLELAVRRSAPFGEDAHELALLELADRLAQAPAALIERHG